MDNDNYELLERAIREKLQVIATYDGRRREMCPHTLGLKYGSVMHVLVYQFGGESKSGLEPVGSTKNWRCLEVARLHDVELRPGQWHSYAAGRGRQSCVDAVEVSVDS